MLVALLLLVLCAASGCAAFKFVYIPCEHGQPMEEWCLAPKDQEDEIGCLTNHLQLWFGKRGLTEEQKREFKQKFRDVGGSWCCAPVSEKKAGAPHSHGFRLMTV